MTNGPMDDKTKQQLPEPTEHRAAEAEPMQHPVLEDTAAHWHGPVVRYLALCAHLGVKTSARRRVRPKCEYEDRRETSEHTDTRGRNR